MELLCVFLSIDLSLCFLSVDLQLYLADFTVIIRWKLIPFKNDLMSKMKLLCTYLSIHKYLLLTRLVEWIRHRGGFQRGPPGCCCLYALTRLCSLWRNAFSGFLFLFLALHASWETNSLFNIHSQFWRMLLTTLWEMPPSPFSFSWSYPIHTRAHR